MANIKSAKKRINVTLKKTMRNKIVRSRTKTAVKGVMSAIAASDKTAAQQALKGAVAAIDKAASKGVMHKNTASRKKSRLYKMVNKVSA